MENPESLLRRARRSRRNRRQVAAPRQTESVQIRRPPLPTGHAGYSALMRSHDRMFSRHISRSGET